jgi:peroxiredoxin family protein
MKPSLAIFLHSHGHDRVYQAVSLSLAAASLGWSCHVFLFFQALATYLDGSWDTIAFEEGPAGTDGDDAGSKEIARRLERGFETAAGPSVYDMLEKARGEGGGVKIYACSASVKLLELDPGAVHGKVDEIVGLPTMLRIAESARFAWYI